MPENTVTETEQITENENKASHFQVVLSNEVAVGVKKFKIGGKVCMKK